MGCLRANTLLALLACTFVGLSAATSVEDMFEAASLLTTPTDADFVPLSLIELEEHEDTPTPPFSVCKYLLEASAQHVKKGDHWPLVAKHIANVRQSLPEHVRSACDAFIKHNSQDIMSMLQLAVEDDELTAALEAVAQEADDQTPSQSTAGDNQSQSPAVNQQEVFKKFWEEKGKYCGACLTMTKKIQKWLSLNCTQNVIADRVVRMCGTMPPDLKAQCESNRIWMQEYVLKQLFNKFPLPNHCAYIGLCEKTMVIRALQNPLVMADAQNALIEDLEGTNPNAVQENQPVLQQAHETVNTAPEITFDLTDGGVSYRDVDRSSGEGLPKVFMDGTHEPTELRGDAFSLLETEETATQGGFDLSNPAEPRVLVHAQEEDNVNVPIMHVDLKEKGKTKASKTYKFQENHLPIESKWLKGCAACQFTIGALFEFMSNPRAIKSLLPSIKKSCQSCNSAEEIVKCEEFVENHGVAFYQDVVRQGSPSKWCPRLELCEIQYFYPSPHVLADTYGRVKDKITAVSDF